MARDITERKRSEEELRKINRALRTLSAGNMTLIHAVDEASLLRDICQVIVDSGGYPLAWVGYAEQDAAHSLKPVARAGEDHGYLDTLLPTWADPANETACPCGRVIYSGEACIVHDIADRARGEPWRAEAAKRGFASYIALPLRSEGRTFGVLNIYAHEADAFSEEEVKLLSETAADLAFGIVTLRTRVQRDLSERESRQHLAQLRKTLEQAIAAIALTIEKRDPYTAGHQRRTALLGVAIGRELGLPAEQVEGIYFGGLIHDIGKIYVPVEILSRPGRITPVEYAIIKTHPEVGYEIMKDIEFPWPVAEMIRQHHERLDGSGYPLGLKGEEVRLESRILAVADVVEAIASHRPYRPGLGIDTALDEIGRHRGILYDASVVEACTRLFREQGYQFES